MAHGRRVLFQRVALLTEMQRLSPVRRVEIPKLGGGVRTLGIPTVLE